MNLNKLASECRKYAESEQNREFNLEGACHENAIGSAEHIRNNTDYTPLIVWGYVQRSGTDEEPSNIEETEEKGQTHFWVKIKENEKIIDICPVNRHDFKTGLNPSKPYCGDLPEDYGSVKEFYYEGWMTPADLASKSSFNLISSRIQEP